MERTIVGIDVGSSKVCTLVGEIDEGGQVRVIGVGVVPARGLRQGVVVNVEDATTAMAASVEKAERTSGYTIERAYASLSGTHVSSLNSRGWWVSLTASTESPWRTWSGRWTLPAPLPCLTTRKSCT